MPVSDNAKKLEAINHLAFEGMSDEQREVAQGLLLTIRESLDRDVTLTKEDRNENEPDT